MVSSQNVASSSPTLSHGQHEQVRRRISAIHYDEDKMKNVNAIMAALALCASSAVALAQPAPNVIGVDSLLRGEMDLSQLPKLRDWTSNLQSSYDRSGGNGDAGNYLALNGKTATLADMAGPGAVVRIWSAGPAGQIKIYIDDNATPVIDQPFGRLFEGTFGPFQSPLAQTSSGGFYSYVPIPYAKHCRITLDNPGGLYYQINYLTFAPGTTVRPFALPLTADDGVALQSVLDRWKAPGAVLNPLPPGSHSRKVTVGVGKTSTLDNERGPGEISVVQLMAPDADNTDLRRLILRGYFDGHKTPDIEAPAADFFGSAYGRKPFTSLLLAQNVDGVMEARFPMPFGHSARFTLENGTQKRLHVVWNVVMTRKPFHPAEEGYFHAQWSQEMTRRNFPHVWTKVRGQRGHFVGVVQTMAGASGLGFLEGDDQVRVDDQSWGASKVASTVIGPWNGTGTEDCFNSGWYFDKGTNALPVNGLLVKDQSGHIGRINAYRWFLNDAPVFQQSLDAQIEHGGANDMPNTYYSSVAYWYADGQVQPWTVTPAASLLGPPLPPHANIVPPLVLKNGIEGEALVASARVSGGKVNPQVMDNYQGSWSGDNQLFWTDTKPGDTLTLTLPAHPGTFDLFGYFTKAIDYGQVSFTLNGQPVGTMFDGFHDGVVPSGPIALGRVTLPAGASQFVVTITGKNAAATNTLFGLDALELRPVA